jgi:hypothetical protein
MTPTATADPQAPTSPDGAAPPEELPGEAPDEQAPEDVTQLSIEGDADVTMNVVGGRKADQSTLTISGGEIKVAGAMKKGDRVRVVLEGPIAETHFIDIRDPKTREVAATKRKHVLKPDTIERQKVGG